MGIPRFACGGGGSLLSASALRQMDVEGCMRLYHARCMQSDWMVGGCARAHNVTELRALGCGTCDRKHLHSAQQVETVRARLRQERCFFMQNIPTGLEKQLPIGSHAGAVVHTSQLLTVRERDAFFLRHSHPRPSAHAGRRS